MKKLTRAVFFSAFIFIAFPITTLAQTAGKPDNLAIVKTLYDDLGKGNMPGVLAVIDPKAEWFEAENYIYWEGKPFIGPDAIVNGVFAKIGGE